MKYRLLKTDIPVYRHCTNEVVRFLRSEDLDGSLYEDLIHENVLKITDRPDGTLAYCTIGHEFSYLIVQPGKPYRKGFQGTFTPFEEDLRSVDGDLEKLATWYAIGMTCIRIKAGTYDFDISNAIWEVVPSENDSDRSVTIQIGEESKTFYFKRIWDKPEKAGIAEIIKRR